MELTHLLLVYKYLSSGRQQMARWWSVALVVGCGVLGGCATTTNYPYSAAEERQLTAQVMAGADSAAGAGAEVLWLDNDVKALLDSRIDRQWPATRRLEALRELLFADDALHIQYSGSTTKTAMQTYASGTGNCLSMTNLFVAAARYLDLSAQFQTVEVRPTWDQQGAVMIRYEHVVATGRLPNGERYVVDFLPEFVLGDYDSSATSDAVGLSLYFNNLGAESLVEGRTEAAIGYLQQALRLRPESSDAWGNMGAAMRRAGNQALAEFSYLRALHEDGSNFSALNNLAALYDLQGREEEAGRLAKRVERYRRTNPYYHYFVANLFFEKGKDAEAVLLLREAIRLKRDEPEFYQALARIYTRTGDEAKADQTLQQGKKYVRKVFTPPGRNMNHRFWVNWLKVE